MSAEVRRVATVLIVGTMAALCALGVASAAPRLALHDLAGRSRSLGELAGHSAILVVWRGDCGPCLIELLNIRDLEAAAGPAPLVMLALDEPGKIRLALQRYKARPRRIWVADAPAREVLVALNGEPPRLPLALALDRKGGICARHLGLLGTDRVKDWVRRCS
ncbi:MAG: thioredoxin-family protein [Phenylobacterium sp.]|nr:thioredoxin-family protein [Phenylobacterium sp.]